MEHNAILSLALEAITQAIDTAAKSMNKLAKDAEQTLEGQPQLDSDS